MVDNFEHDCAIALKKAAKDPRFARKLLAMGLTSYYEARGEGAYGQRLVQHVILNRVDADKTIFGKNILDVCSKRKQFSCWKDKKHLFDAVRFHLALLKNGGMQKHLKQHLELVESLAVAGRLLTARMEGRPQSDPTHGATFYFSTDINPPYWASSAQYLFGHGKHRFYDAPKPRLSFNVAEHSDLTTTCRAKQKTVGTATKFLDADTKPFQSQSLSTDLTIPHSTQTVSQLKHLTAPKYLA